MLANSTNHLILKLSPLPLFLTIILVLFTFGNAQEPVELIDSNKSEASNNDQKQNLEQQSKCGTKETDYTPCMPRERADSIFSHCCSQYVPQGCHSLCQYESDELTARNLLLQAVKTKKCDLKHFGTILYCASQNQDNRKCCQHLNLGDSKLGVGDRCLRFCDPGSEEGIDSIARADVTCLFNWNVLMYCHHAGIKLN